MPLHSDCHAAVIRVFLDFLLSPRQRRTALFGRLDTYQLSRTIQAIDMSQRIQSSALPLPSSPATMIESIRLIGKDLRF
jgi:hypothetical protein